MNTRSDRSKDRKMVSAYKIRHIVHYERWYSIIVVLIGVPGDEHTWQFLVLIPLLP